MAPFERYMQTYNRIDIALDTFPYAGGTTTCDALWMGVPVVTLRGRTAVGRGGASLLTTLDLTEWIADSPAEYVQIAQRGASDLSRLAELRAGLRQRMSQSRLCDAPRFTSDLEAQLRWMWQQWCATSPR